MKPTDDEKKQMDEAKQGQSPDPQSQYLMAAAEQAAADAALNRAKTVDTVAAAGLKQAQTRKTLADIHTGGVGALANLHKAFNPGKLPQ